ncbi:hypothetical protein HAX54_014781 [Datura stramonium]|uniref:Uncharacterized protein n=1 Tax=Datura stramonium TaxID=4076 RepID=A0ABS8TRI0_DATST|nr:hypothetical protein [Datura stramonium]
MPQVAREDISEFSFLSEFKEEMGDDLSSDRDEASTVVFSLQRTRYSGPSLAVASPQQRELAKQYVVPRPLVPGLYSPSFIIYCRTLLPSYTA